MALRLAGGPFRLSRLSADFAGRASMMECAPESVPSYWLAVAAVHPLGDCDWPGLETGPGP